MLITDKMTSFCTERGYLDDIDADIFHYEIERRLSTFIIAIPFFILAFLLTNFLVASSFMGSFYFLRERTSGYHSKTLGRCILFSLILEIIFLKIVYTQLSPTTSILTFFVSIILILRLGPYNHPNLQMSADEFKACRRRLQIRILAIVTAVTFFCIFKLIDLVYGITTGVAMAMFLLCLAYIL